MFNERILEIFNSNYNLLLKKENENISSCINTIINDSYKESYEVIYREIENTPFYEEVNNLYDINMESIKEFERNNYNKHFYAFDFFTEHKLIFNKQDRNQFFKQIQCVLSENIKKIIISDCTKEFYLNGILHSSRFNSIIKSRELIELEEIKLLSSIINYIDLEGILVKKVGELYSLDVFLAHIQ